MNLCDIKIIKGILAKYGFNFSKSLGQNFLTQSWVVQDIAEQCGANNEDVVVEIGPGIGCLTAELCKVAKKVISLEIDRSLFPILGETLKEFNNKEIIHSDILKTDFKELLKNETADIFACANLPYYITTPAISALLESKCFKQITTMVQKEVAHRICATPNCKNYSAFTIYINFYADTKILFDVPSDCFIPVPKVDSSVISITPLKTPRINVRDEKLFFAVVKASFAQRRKTLLNGLSSGFGSQISKVELEKIITDCGFDAKIRGEKLSIENFGLISDMIYDKINK